MNNEPVAWIDPNKKLPKDGELVSVLVLRGEDDPTDVGDLYPARYNLKDKSFESCGGWFEQDEVKGWLPLSHPAKEKHLSLQKVGEELIAVTYTDDDYRIIEVLWERPPSKVSAYGFTTQKCNGELSNVTSVSNPADLTDEEILEVEQQVNKELEAKGHGIMWFDDGIYVFARALLRKVQEK